MKKLVTLAVVVMSIVSCAVIPKYEETRYILDFRKYIEDGFVITPAPTMSGSYDCLATILIEAKSGKLTMSSESGVSVVAGTGYVIRADGQADSRSDKYKYLDADEMLGKFVDYAKSLGADGIVGLTITKHYEDSGTKYTQGQDVITISGCAIKMK